MTTDLPGAHWFKSSHSESGGQCVEVAWLDEDRVGIRDSTNPSGPALTFASGDWVAFLPFVVKVARNR